jgi:hypothetical protein
VRSSASTLNLRVRARPPFGLAEAEAMSRAASPSTKKTYGVVRVTREWELARSSFYHQREIAAQPGRVLRRRGPKTARSDAALLEKIREVIAASPFYGEGHRKVWARLRFQEVRTSKARVPQVRFLTWVLGLLEFTVSSLCEINRNESRFFPHVGRPTAPRPVSRMLHQPSNHRIRVHVTQFLFPLPNRVDIEIVKPRLPECPRQDSLLFDG